VTVVDTLPAGLTATAISGTGWTCTLATLTCTRSDVLAPGASYPAITLTVSVASSASSTLTNSATVSGGGETNTANDTASDSTSVGPPVINIVVNPPNIIITAGQNGMVMLTLTATGSVNAPATLSCSNLPPVSKCVFNPASPTVSSVPTTTQLTILTDTVAANRPPEWMRRFEPVFAVFLGLPMLVLAFPRKARPGRRSRVVTAILGLLLLVTMISACGGSPNHLLGTPPGTYSIQIHAQAGPASGSATVTVQVK
jgi:hypothetical protein